MIRKDTMDIKIGKVALVLIFTVVLAAASDAVYTFMTDRGADPVTAALCTVIYAAVITVLMFREARRGGDR